MRFPLVMLIRYSNKGNKEIINLKTQSETFKFCD